MDTGQIFSLVDILIVGSGIYLLYCWYLLVFENTVREGILIPSNTMKKCRDLDGYKRFMGIRLLIFAISAVLSGGLGLYSDYVKPMTSRQYLITTGIFFVILIWFAAQIKRGEREFFS
jgi:hypothetical protein